MNRILIVDDDPLVRTSLGRLLERHDYRCEVAEDADAARRHLKEQDFEVVLCDIEMPGPSGLDLVAQIAEELPDTAVVMVTATDDPEVAEEAIRLGAMGYIVKPSSPNEILIDVAAALRRRELERRQRHQLAEYESKLVERSGALRRAVARLEEATEESAAATADTVELLSHALTLRHEETGRHIERVGLYAELIAETAGVERWRPAELEHAAMLHDVGKIGVPDAVLLKPGPLTAEEFGVIKHHSELGHRLLAGSSSPDVRLGATVALYHHERWDGSGYPSGLIGGSIPLEARIAAIADEFDAMSSDRVYRPAVPFDQAVEHIEERRGTKLDPELVDAFLTALPTVRRIRDNHPDPSSVERIRVLVVDDQEMFAVSLARVLNAAGMAVTGTAPRAGAALVAVQQDCPDVVLLDWYLPDADGGTVARGIRQACPDAKVIVVTGAPGDAVLLEAVEAGCVGYLTKDRAIDEVISAVRAAHAGEPVMPASKLASLVRRLRSDGDGVADNPLTAREQEVLELLAAGLSNDGIAERLVISVHTVRNHVQQVITKLDAHSKLEAVATAVRRGIVRYPAP